MTETPALGTAAAPRAGLPLTAPIAAPSILSADFSRLADEVALADPACDWVHCDVMDNHFVPNLTFGPLIVGAVRKLTRAMVDVHLMIEEPSRIVADFRKAGADQITVHLEACNDLVGTLATVRASGARVGLAIKPGSALAMAERYLAEVDTLLVMTVEPGFGGQKFMRAMIEKIRVAEQWRRERGAKYLIEVDGGIAPDTARACRAAGADVFVAGHSIYRQTDPKQALEALRDAIR